MGRSVPSIFVIVLVAGCGGAAEVQTESTLPSTSAFACDRATENATEAWKAYAADLRVDAIRAWVDGALGYRSATAALVSGDVGQGPLARAKRMAVRNAAGASAGAADRADLTLDDAMEAGVTHAEILERFEGLESAARTAWEEARRAHGEALRNVEDGSTMLSVVAVRAPELAREARERAEDVERRAAHFPETGRISVEDGEEDANYDRAHELTRRAATTCQLPAAQLARR